MAPGGEATSWGHLPGYYFLGGRGGEVVLQVELHVLYGQARSGRTFTASQDCLIIPIGVYPVIPVNHLISFTGLDFTARFSRKLLNGAKWDCKIN